MRAERSSVRRWKAKGRLGGRCSTFASNFGHSRSKTYETGANIGLSKCGLNLTLELPKGLFGGQNSAPTCIYRVLAILPKCSQGPYFGADARFRNRIWL